MADETSGQPIEIVVGPDEPECRLDWYLAREFPTFSRTHLRKAINAVGVQVNGVRVKASHRLRPGEVVTITLPELPREGPQPENIPLEILYEDDVLAAINKPPGMVVHPGKGHWSGTLTAALQYHFDQLSSMAGPTRPGIVHRLDRDTSGVLVVAKNDQAHQILSDQFAARTTRKEYFAITAGVPSMDRDQIDLSIGPHPYSREKMAVRNDATSRPAQTFYEVVKRFDGFAALRVLPKTGRTHQIRVHLNAVHCPVLCDRLYGSRAHLTLGELKRGDDDTVLLDRQALHAARLSITHPTTGEPLDFTAPLPADLQQTLDALRTHRAK